MLHELLIALSGHPSPLFNDQGGNKFDRFVSHSERSLLRSLANLGSLQAGIRARCKHISSTNKSPVCRAVTSLIIDGPLSDFQDKCVQVESDVLLQDPDVVGAYDIVPLSGIVRAFDGWQRKLDWLSRVISVIDGTIKTVPPGREEPQASGAMTIDFLRSEACTGFPDIEEIALILLKAAETTWIRQAAFWLLYGTLPSHGQEDFFINIHSTSSVEDPGGEIRRNLLPSFVDHDTAHSMLFIGKSLRHIRRNAVTFLSEDMDGFETVRSSLLAEHTTILAKLQYPIQTFALSKSVALMKSSMSRNALRKLLPLSGIIQMLNVLREFMLLERGEFSVALIEAADDFLSNRYANKTTSKDTNRLGGMMINEQEMNTVLSATWATLTALQDVNDDAEDETLESARHLMKLSLSRIRSVEAVSPEIRQGTVHHIFRDVLLATPATLDIDVIPPYDLFLAGCDIEMYSRLNSYLLSIRRTGMHISQLWKISVLRKSHTASERSFGKGASIGRERRDNRMRANWAIISNVQFFFNQLGNYLQGEVVKGCTDCLYEWLCPKSGPTSEPAKLNDTDTAVPTSSNNHVKTPSGAEPSMVPQAPNSNKVKALRTTKSLEDQEVVATDLAAMSQLDPETIAAAHKVYLSHLTYLLLLDDAQFVTSLRNLMTRVDHMVTLICRLSVIVQALQSEDYNDTRSTALEHYAQEELDLFTSMSSVRRSMKSGLDQLIQRLREVDEERSRGTFSSTEMNSITAYLQNSSNTAKMASFKLWKGANLASLLLRLEPDGGNGNKNFSE